MNILHCFFPISLWFVYSTRYFVLKHPQSVFFLHNSIKEKLNYSFVCCKVFVLKNDMGRSNVLHWMVARISRVWASRHHNWLNSMEQSPYYEAKSHSAMKPKRSRHRSLFLTRRIQPTSSHPVYLRFIWILSCHLYLDLSSGLLSLDFPTVIL